MTAQIYSIVATEHCGAKAKELIKILKPGTALVLVREPANKFDKNAIAVYADGEKIGYIPKNKNILLAAAIDAGGRAWTAPQPVGAMDSHPENVPVHKAVDGKFKPSPNSAFPQVEVEVK